MTAARKSFYDTISVMRDAANDPLLIDSAVGSSQHNTRARILRNGLIVSSFSLLETYVEDRLEEKIRDLSAARMSYSAFGEALKNFLTVDAIVGLATRIGFTDKSDRLQIAERHIARASGFLALPPTYTALGFSPKGSNVSDTDIKNLFAAFGIQDAWRHLSSLCASLGSSRLSLRDDFRNFLRDRNRVAHDSATNIASSDMHTHLATALLIGMTADMIITETVNCFVKKRSSTDAQAAANRVSLVSIRFIDEQIGGLWLERIGLSGSVIRRYPEREKAIHEAKSRSRGLPIVVRNASLMPTELV